MLDFPALSGGRHDQRELFKREVTRMSELTKEIDAYGRLQRQLEIDHLGKWVVIHDERLAGIYETFEAAAEDAVGRFARGPYLIRQIGVAETLPSPSSLMYHPV